MSEVSAAERFAYRAGVHKLDPSQHEWLLADLDAPGAPRRYAIAGAIMIAIVTVPFVAFFAATGDGTFWLGYAVGIVGGCALTVLWPGWKWPRQRVAILRRHGLGGRPHYIGRMSSGQYLLWQVVAVVAIVGVLSLAFKALSD